MVPLHNPWIHQGTVVQTERMQNEGEGEYIFSSYKSEE